MIQNAKKSDFKHRSHFAYYIKVIEIIWIEV